MQREDYSNYKTKWEYNINGFCLNLVSRSFSVDLSSASFAFFLKKFPCMHQECTKYSDAV